MDLGHDLLTTIRGFIDILIPAAQLRSGEEHNLSFPSCIMQSMLVGRPQEEKKF